MPLLNTFLKTALKLIAEHGAKAVISRKLRATYAPDQSDGDANDSESSTTTKAVISSYKNGLIDGARIRMGDQNLLLAADGLAKPLAVGDVVEVAGIKWNVVAVNPVMYQGATVYYDAQVRR